VRTVCRSVSLSQPFRSSQFDYRTTCIQKADQNRALPRQIGKDCLLTSSMCYKELVKRANVVPQKWSCGLAQALSDPRPS